MFHLKNVLNTWLAKRSAKRNFRDRQDLLTKACVQCVGATEQAPASSARHHDGEDATHGGYELPTKLLR